MTGKENGTPTHTHASVLLLPGSRDWKVALTPSLLNEAPSNHPSPHLAHLREGGTGWVKEGESRAAERGIEEANTTGGRITTVSFLLCVCGSLAGCVLIGQPADYF